MHNDQILWCLSISFEDVPTGLENVNQREQEVVQEQAQSQEAREEEQKAFPMSLSNPNEEVTIQRSLAHGSNLSLINVHLTQGQAHDEMVTLSEVPPTRNGT